MLFVRRLLHAAVLYVQFSAVLSAKTFWIAEDCSNYPHIRDALDEAIWVAGRVRDSIGMKEPWLDEYLVWFFALNVHSPAISYIQKTFSRIADLQPADSQLDANLRIHCDNDRRFAAVDSNLNNLLEKPQPGTDSWVKTRIYDRQNQIIVLGSSLSCSKAQPATAYVQLDIESTFNKFSPRPSLQLPDRHVITLCDALLKNQVKKPWTHRGFANRRLENVKHLASTNPLAANVLTHEMVHVAFLSEQAMTMSVGEGVVVETHGRDYHPVGKKDGNKSGYYSYGDVLTPGESLGNPEWAIMNPDSYAYLATIYRLRDKQWEAYREQNGHIRLRENVNLPKKGDWPNAPPDVEH